MVARVRSKRRDAKVGTASPASEQVVSGITGERPNGRMNPLANPAERALIISPDLDLKIRKALRREARRIAFRLRIRQPFFEISYLALKLRYASLRIIGRLAGSASKFALRRHG